MRTISCSCALLAILPTLLAACDGGAARNSAMADRPAGSLFESPAVMSPSDAIALANSLRGAGADADALAVLAAAHRRHPENARILSAYGRQALLMGQSDRAEPLLRRALDADPNDWRALSALAALEGRKGRIADARLALDRARTLAEGNAVVLNNLGMSHLLEGNAAEAASLFRKALIAPDLKAAHAGQIKRNLAVALAVQGDFAIADRLAGEPMPRELKSATREAIARFVGLAGRPADERSGWTARLADASEFTSDP